MKARNVLLISVAVVVAFGAIVAGGVLADTYINGNKNTQGAGGEGAGDGSGSGTTDADTFLIDTSTSSNISYVGLPEKGKKDEVITFQIAPLSGYDYAGDLEIKSAGNLLPVTEAAGSYSFTMPGADVHIKSVAVLGSYRLEKDDTHIAALLNEAGEEVTYASAGEKIKFKAASTVDFRLLKVKCNGSELEIGDDGFYSFVMPARGTSITCEHTAIPYKIKQTNTLTNSTIKVYKDASSKTAITEAIKGDKVYVEFTSSDPLFYTVKGTHLVETVPEAIKIDKDSKTVYSFDMISADIDLAFTEAVYPFADKEYKGYNYYGSGNKLEEKTYADVSGKSLLLNEDKTGKYNGNNITFDVTGDIETEGSFTMTTALTVKEVYYTEHLAVCQDANTVSASTNWSDIDIFLADDTYTLKTLGFSTTRVVCAIDGEGKVVEAIYMSDLSVYAGVTLEFLDDTSLNFEGHFLVKDSEGTVITEVKNMDTISSYNLTDDGNTDIVYGFEDAEGNAITEAKNGDTVYFFAKLSDTAAAGLALDGVGAYTSATAQVAVNAVTGKPNYYSFTMPKSDIELRGRIVNPTKYAGSGLVGNFIGYNIYSGKNGDMAGSTMSKTLSFAASGFGEYNSYTVEASACDATAVGGATLEYGLNKYIFKFGSTIAITSYSAGGTTLKDAYILFKLNDGEDKEKISTYVQWFDNSGNYAVTYLYDGVERGNMFIRNNAVYGDCSFEFTTGTRVQSGSVYDVKDSNGTVVYHVAADGTIS